MTQPSDQPPLTHDLAAIMTEVVDPGHGGGRFGHREHIHLAFLAARRGDAADLLRDWIRQIAASHEEPTATTGRSRPPGPRIVAHHVRLAPAIADFDAFAARFPALLDKTLLARHYSPAALASRSARSTWITPDLTPIPSP
jgi:hypothetical protein